MHGPFEVYYKKKSLAHSRNAVAEKCIDENVPHRTGFLNPWYAYPWGVHAPMAGGVHTVLSLLCLPRLAHIKSLAACCSKPGKRSTSCMGWRVSGQRQLPKVLLL